MAEDRKPRRRRAPSAPNVAASNAATSDAIDIAMHAEASGREPDGPSRRVLIKHERLLDEQIGLARNERFRNRIRAVRDMALAALVLAFVGGLGAIVWNASRASGVVVEPFRTPSDLAATGLDGTVVAARLLDRLAAMQKASDSARAPETFSSNWNDDLQVEISDTGVSLSQVNRYLRRTLGDETVVTGELVRTPTGVAITTRVGAGDPVTVEGPLDQLNVLLDQAAEGLFRRAQPYRYAVWLPPERLAEARAILRAQLRSGSREERLWALNGLAAKGYADDRLGDVRDYGLQALELDPTFDKARWNVADVYDQMGQSSLALSEDRKTLRATARRDPRVTDASRLMVHHLVTARVSRYLGDHGTAVAAATEAMKLDDYSGNRALAPYVVAEARAALHEVSASRRWRARADLDPAALPKASALVALHEAAVLDEPAKPGVIAAATAPAEGFLPSAAPALVWSFTAPAMARNGDIAGARALIGTSALSCYPCVIARGQIAALDRQPAEADRWFAQAARLAPELPSAWLEWGRAKLARGDAAGALPLLRKAHETGPRWADPLKYEADALLAQGKAREAEKLYRQAVERAPRWGALHLACGDAMARLGKARQAREAWRTAGKLDLSAADRAVLGSRLSQP